MEMVKLMCSYCKKHKETEVPDLYYGGQQGFGKQNNNPQTPITASSTSSLLLNKVVELMAKSISISTRSSLPLPLPLGVVVTAGVID
ncbi:hypothetical protein QJS10_CPB20g01555 [Acorus calamus]|uniref:Uncharacterized protein n=1 Tax=Acorus calamus TaxID=4465 RepID=A0AAV9CA66_ACOCL|nr:hypothetical protein QJS10_CPB20g01555 [Acorus calamus]